MSEILTESRPDQSFILVDNFFDPKGEKENNDIYSASLFKSVDLLNNVFHRKSTTSY